MRLSAPIVRVSFGIAALAALLVGSFLGTVIVQRAFAQPGGDVIYACKGERSGSLRVVDGPGNCLRGEVEISWDSAGGVTGWVTMYSDTVQVAQPGGAAFFFVSCGPDKAVLSGGVQRDAGSSRHYTVESFPSGANNVMTFALYNHDTVDPARVFGWVICADAS